VLDHNAIKKNTRKYDATNLLQLPALCMNLPAIGNGNFSEKPS
jgi:hypothetical protein